jgi:hypothetical protein
MHIHLQENLTSHEWPDRPRSTEVVKSLYMISTELRPHHGPMRPNGVTKNAAGEASSGRALAAGRTEAGRAWVRTSSTTNTPVTPAAAQALARPLGPARSTRRFVPRSSGHSRHWGRSPPPTRNVPSANALRSDPPQIRPVWAGGPPAASQVDTSRERCQEPGHTDDASAAAGSSPSASWVPPSRGVNGYRMRLP